MEIELDTFLQYALTKRASDIHLLPGLKPMLRVDGSLIESKEYEVLTPEDTKKLMYQMMKPEEQEEFEKNLVVELALLRPFGNFRASIYHQRLGVAAVLRIVPSKIPTVDDINLPAPIKQLLTLSHGIILVAGPTGSGKSSTLAAMVDYINTFRSCNIITIEDPIEYIHPNKRSILNQLQVGRDATDFAAALRASLRQDPNVILLGELRDLESMRLALTASETGHLVLATLHASSSSIAISRFVDVFPSEEKNRVRTLLSETIHAVLCQRLVKKISGGRVAAYEVMLSSPAIRQFIRADMPGHIESAIQTSLDKGMITLDQYLENLVKKKIINPANAAAIASELSTFEEAQKGEKK